MLVNPLQPETYLFLAALMIYGALFQCGIIALNLGVKRSSMGTVSELVPAHQWQMLTSSLITCLYAINTNLTGLSPIGYLGFCFLVFIPSYFGGWIAQTLYDRSTR